MPGNDVTVKAQWTVNQYTITFDTDGGSAIDAITQDYGTAVQAPADPTKAGYTFKGWSPELPKTMPAQDVTVKAQWTVNQYTISFDTDGGSAIDAITQDYGTAVKAPADPTKTGYTFKGWSPELPATMPAKDMTVKAQWTVNQYTITFNTRGGTAIDAITLDYGAKVTAPKAPTKKGFTFNGWKPALPARMPAKDMTVRASWKVNQYTITFNTRGGTAIDAITLDYGAKVTAPKAPTKRGYTFTGWKPALPARMPAKNLKVKAGWTANTYSVVFNRNGGKGAMKAQAFTYGAAKRLTGNTFVRTNFRFVGWNTKADGSGKAYANKEKVQNLTAKANGRVTLYAQWERKEPSGMIIPTVQASGATTLNIRWTKMENVDGYDVFMTRCGDDAYSLLATVTGEQSRSVQASQLEKHKNYKFYVQAWVMNGSEKSYVSKSLSVHSMTGDTYGRRTNAKKVEVTKTAYTMDVGRVDMIHANVVGVNPNKLVVDHGGLLRYVTDDSRVAIVNRSGRITAVGKGRCKIYVLASNGVYAKVRVVVE